MQALVVGATGATGKDLVRLLLSDDTFRRVDVFVRRPLELQHSKLSVHLIDFDRPEQWRQLVQGDVLFSCLGTTLKAAGSKAAQWTIDYDYQYRFAQAAREAGVRHYVLVSAGNASAKSPFFYARMKGQLEAAVKALGFAQLTIFRPPLLIRKDTDRPGEVAGRKVIQWLNRFGLFRSQQPLPTDVLAQAMIHAARAKADGFFSYEGEEIRQRAVAG